MRVLTNAEKVKRGCIYCTDFAKKRLEPGHTMRCWVCMHDECPYHELDPYDNYAQYLKSEKPTRLMDAIVSVMNIERKIRF